MKKALILSLAAAGCACAGSADALLTSTINCVTSFISGFAIFSILGYMAHEHKVNIEDVATEGGLVVLPTEKEGAEKLTFFSAVQFSCGPRGAGHGAFPAAAGWTFFEAVRRNSRQNLLNQTRPDRFLEHPLCTSPWAKHLIYLGLVLAVLPGKS